MFMKHGVSEFKQYAISNYCGRIFLNFYLFEAVMKKKINKLYKNVNRVNVEASLKQTILDKDIFI